jgi:hypothetical protein
MDSVRCPSACGGERLGAIEITVELFDKGFS